MTLCQQTDSQTKLQWLLSLVVTLGQGVMKAGLVNTDKYMPLGNEAILAVIAPSGGIRKLLASDLSINWTITITNV